MVQVSRSSAKAIPETKANFALWTVADLIHRVGLKLIRPHIAVLVAEAVPAEQECVPVQRNAAGFKPLECCQPLSPVALSTIATISGWLAASLTTLMPSRFRAATSAPRSIRSRAMSASPRIAAVISGVMPN